MPLLLAIFLGYLVGSLPVVYLLARARGVDLHALGTGNVGGGNLWRHAGPLVGLTGILAEIAKGVVPPLALALLGMGPAIQAWGGIAALAGQMWPVTLRFQGGRGNATGAGVLLALSPLATAAAFTVFLVIASPKVLGIFTRRRMGSSSATVPLGVIVAIGACSPIALLIGTKAAALGALGILGLLLLRRATAPWPLDPGTGLPPRRSFIALLLFDRPTLRAPEGTRAR
ncbi:MAG: glycerol-3-phosphate acyltransferase [Chloroflexi bacterium]|nr:glycerol-3-phosphate acyltransferase [Chloroflexota bacterium]